jgi:hypothetical protein
MPGVDFERIRAMVRMEQVLNLLGFEPLSRSGCQWYGSCPLPGCGADRRRRRFSVNVELWIRGQEPKTKIPDPLSGSQEPKTKIPDPLSGLHLIWLPGTKNKDS